MVKQSNPPTENEIRTLLGDATVDSWNQEKVTLWLEEKGWGQFASTFEKYGICRERFFQITLAELVQYLPRTMTTYYERRRLLNEIRSLVPSTPGKPTPTTPTNISINTNLHEYNNPRLGGVGGGVLLFNNPPNSISPRNSSDNNIVDHHLTTRDSGIGYLSHYSAGSSSSPSPSASPSSDNLTAPFNTKRASSSPTRTSYSPKAAFNKIKNTFRSSPHAAMNSASPSPRTTIVRHESAEDDRGKRLPAIPARVSSTPDKISKFWATYTHWHTSPNKKPSPSNSYFPAHPNDYVTPTVQQKKLTDQRIQITGDKETWYSLNVTNMRDPVAIKQHILQRMKYDGDCDQYQYFHENGSDPDASMDPQELMYLCSIADHSASQRILVKPAAPSLVTQQQYRNFAFTLSTPELGESPTTIATDIIPSQPQQSPIGSPNFRPLCRKTARRPYVQKSSVGIQLSDPPTLDYLERQRTGSVPSIIAPPSLPNNTWRRSEPDIDKLVQDVCLWAVAPQNQTNAFTPTPPPAPAQQLWAVTPPATNNDENPLNYTKTSSNAEFWGERPPAEVVFKHMERYFDSQDLDKEVVVVEPSSTPMRKLTHTKSIRVVAREASRKYNLAARQNKMLRRKSTKLWGQKVVEVKTRSAQVMARLPSVSEHMRLSHNNTNAAATEVQWIRGKLIGKGSFGRVYLAFNVGTGEVIAVKQVEIPRTASDLLNEDQHNMVEALYQEIMTLRDLDHENIVQYLGYGQDDAEGVINIFLEYVSGGSVASRLALHGAFDENLTKYFTKQICSGLEYLHSKHILHRDIKAANILVEVDGVCKISDFGLSKKNDYDEVYDQNSRMSLRGSIYWMAPEVVKNEPYSAKVDIWSLGCTVIEMLTGQRPWLSLNQIAALYNLGRLNSPTIPDNISDCAKDFLRQCFIIDPTKRPTATDLLNHQFLNLDTSFQFKDYVDKGKI